MPLHRRSDLTLCSSSPMTTRSKPSRPMAARCRNWHPHPTSTVWLTRAHASTTPSWRTRSPLLPEPVCSPDSTVTRMASAPSARVSIPPRPSCLSSCKTPAIRRALWVSGTCSAARRVSTSSASSKVRATTTTHSSSHTTRTASMSASRATPPTSLPSMPWSSSTSAMSRSLSSCSWSTRHPTAPGCPT